MQIKSPIISKALTALWVVVLLCSVVLAQNMITRNVVRDGKAVAYQFSLFETGTASWYGGEFHGRKTANGEIFDKNSLTAAHKTLPFGTWVLVKNLSNSKEVLVRINDRGPFAKGRIIDLSEAGARMLGMLQTGTAHVELYVMQTPLGENVNPSTAPIATITSQGKTGLPGMVSEQRYKIQTGSYSVEQNAVREMERLKGYGLLPAIEHVLLNGKTLFRIIVIVSDAELASILGKLAQLGITNPLVTKLSL